MLTLDIRSPGLLELVDADADAQRIACGFRFTEGPVWRRGALLFSDIPQQRIAQWRQLPEGPEVTTHALGTSNGLALDRTGSVLVAGHDGRHVVVEDSGGLRRTVLADSYQDKRLNSPNDLVVKSDGSVYFTDPPYAVERPFVPGRTRPEGWWDVPLPGKELACNGVYRLEENGTLRLVADDMALPNGLAFSPDERVLYVDDSARKHLRTYEVLDDGSLSNGRVLVDMSTSADPGVPDGLKVDVAGNIFCTGPGGIWVCRPCGEVLGRILLPEQPANMAWGEDGSKLFVTAQGSVYRIETRTCGMLRWSA